MHVLEVVVPVIQRWVERKLFAFFRRDLVPYLRDVARIEDAVDLGVDAVELDEVDGAFQALPFPVRSSETFATSAPRGNRSTTHCAASTKRKAVVAWAESWPRVG